MLESVPRKPRSNPYRRRRAVTQQLPNQAAAAKRPAESSASASSCFHSEVISTTSSNLSPQRPAKRSRHPDADAAGPAVSECSEVVGSVKARVAEVEASDSSCLGSVLESDLTCPEQLADEGEESEYSSAREELSPSVLEGKVICGFCATDSSAEYSLSSDSEDDAAGPSPTFSRFLAFAEQFVPCTNPNARALPDVALLPGRRFEELDDEESYERFRRRERRGAAGRDYGEVYSSMPGSYGRLVMDQRVVIVNWIIEHSQVLELQPETVFMGVGLMDRFLTRGYLKSTRNLQLLGIACITLATRIEENQPYNCILQQTFKVGINVYSRSEVVAMEWLVQEVLNFQCFVTTTHHFLWFYLKAAKADDKIEGVSKHLALLSLLDHQQLSFWPSSVAAAVVVLACLATNNESSCHLIMETHMRTKNDDLAECIKVCCLSHLLMLDTMNRALCRLQYEIELHLRGIPLNREMSDLIAWFMVPS